MLNDKTLLNKSSQNYVVSHAVWDHAHSVLPATQHKWTNCAATPVRHASSRFTYSGGTKGWVDLGDWLSYVPTADHINLTVQITQSSRPSSTDQDSHVPDQRTKSARVWSSNDCVLVKYGRGGVDRVQNFMPITLDPYTVISQSTRPLLDQYPITSRLLLGHLPTRSVLNFFWFWQSKIIL